MPDTHPPSPAATHDVVIAGAGPVGLFLACELSLAKLSVLVLDQAADPHGPMKRAPFGLRGLSVPTVEALHRRGLLDELAHLSGESVRADGGARAVAHWQNQARRPAGHFAGIPFFEDRIDPARWPYRLPGPAAAGMASTMGDLEAVLARRALATGVEIRRGVGVDGVEPGVDGVAVRAGGEVVRGRWLVGCDGGRSAVRKAAGFAFAGTDPEFTGYSVEVELDEPALLRPGRQHTAAGVYTYAPPGTIAMADFDGGAAHRSVSITRDGVQAVLRRVTGTDVAVTALHLAATWTDRALQATTYRKGRVLLAGDAAHIHSPLGGQGVNLGLGDAMNLGWKLAATVRGDAPDGLLDTYEAERHGVGARILDWSRAQVALLRPTPGTRALGAIIRDLVDTREGATYFAERVWGLSLRYDLGGDHPLVGRSAPDFALADGARLGERLRDGKGLLLDFGGTAALAALAGRWADRVTYLAREPEDRLGLSALLLRPDGVVAWASDGAEQGEAAAHALSRWFGDASPPGSAA